MLHRPQANWLLACHRPVVRRELLLRFENRVQETRPFRRAVGIEQTAVQGSEAEIRAGRRLLDRHAFLMASPYFLSSHPAPGLLDNSEGLLKIPHPLCRKRKMTNIDFTHAANYCSPGCDTSSIQKHRLGDVR